MKPFKIGVAVVAMGVGFVGTAVADPFPRGVNLTGGAGVLPHPLPPRVDTDYVVLYKPTIFSPWREYGRFETPHQARHAERRLELFGRAVRVVPVRDYHPGHGWHR